MLVCPEVGEECYIGLSEEPEIRYTAHLNPPYLPVTAKERWVYRLRVMGYYPRMTLLDEIADKQEAYASERDVIRMMRAIRGESCLNMQDYSESV
jgi:hypothetical protein